MVLFGLVAAALSWIVYDFLEQEIVSVLVELSLVKIQPSAHMHNMFPKNWWGQVSLCPLKRCVIVYDFEL